MIEKIGTGTFGKVYKALHQITHQERAIKVVKKEVLNYQDDEKKFLKEIEMLAQLDHPNIVKVYEYFEDSHNYFVAQELARGGELYEQIYQINSFNEKIAAIIMEQLFSCVYYLHSLGIVHRDLKPENIMLESKKQGDFSIKLIDFGTANYYKPNQGNLTMKVGTPYYIAPEVINKNYNNKCDIWSCGIIMFILLCGYPPFDGDNDEEILKSIQSDSVDFSEEEWNNVSPAAKNLIKKLLVKDPSRRISAADALKDEWVMKYTKTETNVNLSSQFKNILKYTSKQKLQQASLAFMVHNLSTSEMTKDLRKVFKSLDSSGCGRLNYEELKRGFKEVNKDQISDEEFEMLSKQIDQDGSGFIEFEEFLTATINMELLLTEQNLRVAYNFFDKDKNGELDMNEIKDLLGLSNSKEDIQTLKEIITEVDSNGDGVVSYQEFKDLMRRMNDRKT